MAERSLKRRLFYRLLWLACRILGVALFGVRCRGRQFLAADGGALLLSNHQSHLDPLLVALSCDRPINALARQSLFRHQVFARVIYALNAIPIDREGSGLSAIKETLRRLKRGEQVLIFVEGTRTYDGEVAPLKPGFVALARRAGVPLVPMAIDGAFDAWPRSRLLPRPALIHVQLGRPIEPAEIPSYDDEQLLAEVQRRIVDCRAAARRDRQRAMGGPAWRQPNPRELVVTYPTKASDANQRSKRIARQG